VPIDLVAYGWNETLAEQFAPYAAEGFLPARVVREHTHIYRIYTAEGDRLARVTGRFRHDAHARQAFPAVGDWVAMTPGTGASNAQIHAVLPRKSRFSRKVSGDTTEEQIVAANIDMIFLVSALDRELNLRRLERYLVLAREGGAQPVILLNKSDLCPDVAARLGDVAGIAPDVPMLAVSALRKEGLERLYAYLAPGRTVAVLGSSGVGKSTLINQLLGEDRQKIGEVRARDRRGRHTTTNRELLVLPGGALIIDTPGLREIQLWETEGGVRETFDAIEALAPACFFRDCQHLEEPRCAVKTAVAEGRLAAPHLDNYHKLKRELRSLKTKIDG
jgi:ribosome biogenesis GTPase / thiamine phosphate phosphatase